MRSIFKTLAEIWNDPNPNPQPLTKEQQNDLQLRTYRNGAFINAFFLALLWTVRLVWPALQAPGLVVVSILPAMTLASNAFRYVHLRIRLENER